MGDFRPWWLEKRLLDTPGGISSREELVMSYRKAAEFYAEQAAQPSGRQPAG